MLDKPSSDEQDFHGGGKRMAKNGWEYTAQALVESRCQERR